MVATGYRQGRRLEWVHGKLITVHRGGIAVWRHRCVSWCLRRTVRRGWTRILPPARAERPLYAAGTRARIDRLRLSDQAGCPRPRPRPAGQTLWWEAAGRREL